jgi:hypothetical protein
MKISKDSFKILTIWKAIHFKKRFGDNIIAGEEAQSYLGFKEEKDIFKCLCLS